MDISKDTILVSAPLTDSLTWELNEGGILRVFGEGAMPDWSRNSLDTRPWEPMRALIREVHAENGVTRIGARSFCGYENLTAVFLPETLTSVSYHAFLGCRNLEQVSVPDDVTWRFFYEHTIPERWQTPAGIHAPRGTAPENASGQDASRCIRLGLHAFARTPWGIRTFGEFVIRGAVLLAYMGCGESVTIPPEIRRIHDFAFAGLPVTEVDLPEYLQEIGAFAFNDTRLRLPRLPWCIQRVEDGAFSNIPEFEGAVFPRANMTKVYFHPRAFLSSALSLPNLAPGKNRRFYIRQTPLPKKPGILELQLAAREKYVGVDMVRIDLELEKLLEKKMTLVQIIFDPETRTILRITGCRELYYNFRTPIVRCAAIAITGSGEYRLKTLSDYITSSLFGYHYPHPILSRLRSLASLSPFKFSPGDNQEEVWLACPQVSPKMDSESFLAELKRGLFAWQDMHADYRLAEEPQD